MELTTIALVLVPAAIFFFAVSFVANRYKRCPSNRVLVVYGKVGEGRTAKCVHGGGTFVLPLIQDYTYLSLEPIPLDIDLKGALSKENIRVHVPSTFTIGISTKPEIMQNAAERLLGADTSVIKAQASDIIFGQLRQAIATMTIEEINQHREKFLSVVNDNVGSELRKIGLEVINVNIRDLNDEAGYIKAIGQKAAAEAVNKANIEVAQQRKIGETGVAEADREREITVAEQKAQTASGKTKAESAQRIQIAKLEAEAVAGENTAKASVAATNAALQVKQAEANQLGAVASANAQKAVLEAQKAQEVAKLEKEQLAQQEVALKLAKVKAEAEAVQIITIAKAKADAIFMEKEAEARGVKAILEAKAEGYKNLVTNLGQNAPTLLTIEQLPILVNAQVEAIKNIKVDKITVLDSPNGGDSSISHLFKGFARALPGVHEMAKNVGLDLPQFLGEVKPDTTAGGAVSTPAAPKNGAAGAPRTV
jgi:flotillin